MTRPVTIVGAGAGACAAAVDVARRGCDVLMLNRSEERLTPIRDAGGLRCIVEGEDYGITPITRLTTDAREAMAFSTTVLIVVPTTALRHYAEQLGPGVSAEHRVLLLPGHTGGSIFFDRALQDAGGDEGFLLGETHTLPYICRKTASAEVTVWKRNRQVHAAALPATRNNELHGVFDDLVMGLVSAESVLETSLSNTNAVMHPPGMLLNSGWIERTHGGFKFYAEGHTPAVGRVIDELDKERLAIGRAFGLDLRRWIDVFYDAGYTTQAAWETGQASIAISASEPNSAIDAPESLQHRYVREDFGYGLVPMSALARVAGVPTPVTDALVVLGSTATGTDLVGDGLNAEDMGVGSLSMGQLKALVEG